MYSQIILSLKNNIYSEFNHSVRLDIKKITPSAIGIGGGTELTITGSGFTDNTGMVVLFGKCFSKI